MSTALADGVRWTREHDNGMGYRLMLAYDGQRQRTVLCPLQPLHRFPISYLERRRTVALDMPRGTLAPNCPTQLLSLKTHGKDGREETDRV